MTTALKGAAAHLVSERQADHFMGKLFILEHHWGAPSPRSKKQFWHGFITSQYSPLKKTPYEWYHRVSWLLKKCPDLAPAGTVSDQFLRDKMIDGMPHTWARVINTIHEYPNKEPAHIAQRLENYYQNLRTSSNKSDFAKILLTGMEKKEPPTKRPTTNAPQPDFPPQPPPTPAPGAQVLRTTEDGAPIPRTAGQCWSCGAADHYFYNCPKSPTKGKGTNKGKGEGKGGKNSKGKGGKGGKDGKKGKKGKKGKGKNSEKKTEI